MVSYSLIIYVVFIIHRWSRLLKQQLSITVLSFANQENQTSVFRFCLQQTNRNCHFVSTYTLVDIVYSSTNRQITNFHLHTEQNGKRGKENGRGSCFSFEMAKYKHTNSSFRIYCTYIYDSIYILKGSIYIRVHIYAAIFKWKTENRSPGDFLLSVYHLLIVQTGVCCLSVC